MFCGLALGHCQSAAHRAAGERVDICVDVDRCFQKGGVTKITSEIPAPHLKSNKEGVVDPKVGPSMPCKNSRDVCGSPPRTISPSGEGDLDLDAGVVPWG